MTRTEAARRRRTGYAVRPFRAAWWLPGAHAQTIVGRFLRRRTTVPLRRERLETPDGDFLDLDHALGGPTDAAAPLVVVLHGLEGCAGSGYMAVLMRQLLRQGIRAVGLNFRSCSGEPNRTARFYHAGETEDLHWVLRLLRARNPEAAVGAVGFSLGGNVLLKYLGEQGAAARPLVHAAVAVSVPFDLAAGAAQLERGMGRVYTGYFMRKLRRKSREKAQLMADRCDLARVHASRTLREFDDAATAPLHGFRDAEDYYARSSCAAFLAGVRVPTLLLHSVDDPFLPTRAVPRRRVVENPVLVDGFTGRGGHVGFVGGLPWRPVFWAECEAARFLAAHLLAGAEP